MDATGYYRFPTIYDKTVVFVSEDDLWAVDAGGGIARRLTASNSEVAYPRFSPDGRWIAFVGREEGHPEVYVVPAQGGVPRRLTFLGGEACIVCGWTPQGGEILFTSDAYSPFVKETHAFAVPLEGGPPRALGLGHAVSIDIAAEGVLLGRNANDTARWKRYRGGMAGEVWVDLGSRGRFSRLTDLPGPVNPFWLAGRAYFVSDHEGIANLYSCAPDGSDLRKHTDEREYYVRFPATDGSRVVYQAGAQIMLYDPATNRTERIAIETPSAAPQTARRFIEAGGELEHFAPSPDGTRLALVSRGQPYTMPLWEEAVIHHGVGSRVRYRLTEWTHDGKGLVFVDDASGYERIALIALDGSAEKRYLSDGDIGRVTDLAVSPTDDVIAFANHRYELHLLDGKSGELRKLDTGRAMRIDDLAFSPDGKFLAYTWSPTHDVSIIRIAEVDTGTIHDVTTPLRTDRSPAWDPEGNFLYFISTRDFNPVYDALQFDLSFPQAMRPFLVTLRSDVANPFVPKPAPIHREKEDEKEKDKGEEPPPIRIDFDGIAGRVIGFPVEEADYAQIVAAKGRALFTKFPVKGIKPESRTWEEQPELGELQAYDFEQQRCAMLATNVEEIRLGADHRTLIYTSRDRMRVIDAGRDLPEREDEDEKEPTEANRRTGWLDLTRASVEITPHDEWTQMYYESWRLQREHFWDPGMSDVDWERVRERYARLLPKLRTRTELSDLIWEMYGELGTSHAYEIGGDHRTPPQYRVGYLGADLVWDEAAGGYRITRILRGDSWDRNLDSPLAEPGVDARERDVIVDVGGKPLDRRTPPEARLINLAGREISLGLLRDGRRHRVLVKTLRSERMLRYRAWVEENRRAVHAATDGKVGYLHIPDMGPWGFSEFHRGYLSELDRSGLIVDVRYNRGGHVSPLLLEKLARKRVGYDIPRYGPPVPYPPESVAGPIVALTNQFAGSDGDIFSHCFKLYKLGPLVGKRTWGGVIGINPYHRLVDGTLTTQPEFSFWFIDVGWAVENHGTDPDYEVDIAPHDAQAGRDPQLEKALELITAALAQREEPPKLEPRPKLTLPT